MFLDRAKLLEAITFDFKGDNFYARASKLTCDIHKFTSFQIGTAVGQVSLPVKAKDLSSILLLEKLEENPAVIDIKKHFCSLRNEEICKILTHVFSRAAVIDAFGVDVTKLNVSVEAVPEKLIVLSGQETYHDNYTIEKMAGYFGTVLLQIPVEGDKGGVSVTVHNGKESKSFCFDAASEQHFFMAILSAKQRARVKQGFTIKAAHETPGLVLVLNLVCTDSSMFLDGECRLLPEILQSADKASAALNGWKLLADQAKHKFLSSHAKDSADCSLVEEAGALTFVDGSTSQLLVGAAKVKALCLPLRKDYCREQLNFHSLINEDAVVARILMAIGFINVELAIVTCACNPLKHWIHSSRKEAGTPITIVKRFPRESGLFSLAADPQLTFGRSLVGNFKGKLKCPNLAATTCSNCSKDSSNPFDTRYFVAFVITPKGLDSCQDQKTFLNYYVKELINQLPKALDQKSRGNDRLFNHITSETVKIIDAIGSTLKHSQKDCPFLEVVKPLLRLCQRFSAMEPLQKLVHLLFHENAVCVCGFEKVTSPAINSGRTVVSMLAESIVTLKGWKMLNAQFMGLIADNECFPKFLDILCDFAIELYNVNFMAGALELGNALVKQFSFAVARNHAIIGHQSIAKLMSLVCILEPDEASCSSDRSLALVQALDAYSISNLGKILQTHWLKNQESKPLVVLSNSRLIEIILDKIPRKRPLHVFNMLTGMYESADDAKSLSTIWTSLCSACIKAGLGKSKEPQCTLLTIVLSSKTNGDRVKLLQTLEKYSRNNSKLALDALQTIVLKRFRNPANFVTVSTFFALFSLAQAYESLANDLRIESVISLVLRAEVTSIINFCIYVRSTYDAAVKSRPKAKEPYRLLVDGIIKQRLQDILADENKLLADVFASVFCFEDVNLLNSLLQGIVEKLKSSLSRIKCLDVPGIISEVGRHLKSMNTTGCPLQTENLTDLVELWFRSILEKPVDAASSFLIVNFLSFLIIQENYFVNMESMLEELQVLIPQLHPEALVNLIFSLYKLQILNSSTGSSSHSCRNALISSCKRYILDPRFPGKLQKLPENQVIDLMEIAFWTGEETIIASMAKNICSVSPSSAKIKRTEKLLHHPNVRELASKSLAGVEAFNSLIDYTIKCASLDPIESWSLPDAKVPQNTKLERFLKSNSKRETFGTIFTEEHYAETVGKHLVSFHGNLSFEVKKIEASNLFACELFKLAPFTLGNDRAESDTVGILNALRIPVLIDSVAACKIEKMSRPFDELMSTQAASEDDEVQVLPSEPKKPKIDPVIIELD